MNGESRHAPNVTALDNTTTTTKLESILVAANRRRVCRDCDAEILVRGYERCRSCLHDLRAALRRRREADNRMARWSA